MNKRIDSILIKKLMMMMMMMMVMMLPSSLNVLGPLCGPFRLM